MQKILSHLEEWKVNINTNQIIFVKINPYTWGKLKPHKNIFDNWWLLGKCIDSVEVIIKVIVSTRIAI